MEEGDGHSVDLNGLAPGAWPVAWPRARLRSQGDPPSVPDRLFFFSQPSPARSSLVSSWGTANDPRQRSFATQVTTKEWTPVTPTMPRPALVVRGCCAPGTHGHR